MSVQAAILPPLSLYVHIPWCERKCPYCDFNSHKPTSQIDEAAYVQALSKDLASQLEAAAGRKLQSIFFGGGTPSLFSASAIADIISMAEKKLGFADDIEISLEANPGSSEKQKFADFYLAGVNRLSLGVQSFQDEKLKALGRIHSSKEALEAIEAIYAAGFKRFNIDLMHGLPQQSESDALSDLQQAVDAGAAHLSWYQLTIEQNTEFYRYPPVLPEEETLHDIQEAGEYLLRGAGFSQYEVSAFAKSPAHRAKHNMNYWSFGDYMAIGAGAHGKLSRFENGTLSIERFSNTRLPKDYLSRIDNYVSQRETLSEKDVLFEALMNALRLVEGVSTDSLLQASGVEMMTLEAKLQPFIEQGLVRLDDRLCLSENGQRYLNSILEALLD